MYDMHNVRRMTDARKLLIALFAVAVMIAVTFTAAASDSSEAASVNGKTFYYDQLSSDYARTVYNKMADAEFGYEDGQLVATVTIPLTVGSDYTTVVEGYKEGYSEAMEIISYEKVEYYWLGGSSFNTEDVWKNSEGKIMDKDKDGNAVTPRVVIKVFSDTEAYGKTTAEVQKTYSDIQDAMDGIALGDTSSRYKTVTSINKALCDLLQYDNDMPDGRYCRNIATSFLSAEHKVVCEGYAKAFKALCDKYDIPCIIVIGDGVTSKGTEAHMWNYVQMENGKWYLMDVTWNDTASTDKYILAGSETETLNGKTAGQDHVVSNWDPRTPGDHDHFADNWNIPVLSTAEFKKCTLTLINYNGEKIKEVSVSAGDSITLADLSGYAPTREKTATKVFTFAGWEIAGSLVISSEKSYTVVGDAELKAKFDQSEREYIVTFKNKDGSVYATQKYSFDDEIYAPSADPTFPSDKYTVYTFDRWDGFTIGDTVTADGVEYTAVYTESKNITKEGSTMKVYSENNSIMFNSDDLAIAKSTTGTFTVVLTKATIIFDKSAVDSLVADQTLTLKVLSTTALNAKIRESLTKATVYEIDFGDNNDKFSAGKATVAINWEVKPWQKAEDLQVFYIDGETKTLVESTYDADSEQIVFSTNHFSTYAVNADADMLTSIIDLLYENYIVVIIVLITLFLFVIVYRFS